MASRSVAIFGEIGAGKSALLNKICGTRHASSSGAKSCTKVLEHGTCLKYDDLVVIGGPGFGSADEVAAHLAAQKMALELMPLSGVYCVVKGIRASPIARSVENVMDFLGSDDVRVIITHADTARLEEGFS